MSGENLLSKEDCGRPGREVTAPAGCFVTLQVGEEAVPSHSGCVSHGTLHLEFLKSGTFGLGVAWGLTPQKERSGTENILVVRTMAAHTKEEAGGLVCFPWKRKV